MEDVRGGDITHHWRVGKPRCVPPRRSALSKDKLTFSWPSAAPRRAAACLRPYSTFLQARVLDVLLLPVSSPTSKISNTTTSGPLHGQPVEKRRTGYMRGSQSGRRKASASLLAQAGWNGRRHPGLFEKVAMPQVRVRKGSSTKDERKSRCTRPRHPRTRPAGGFRIQNSNSQAKVR